MATQDIRNTVIPAPYLPFKTFLNSFDPFSQGIPPKIDRSLWNQSGFMQGLILNAYRYFHLVDAKDAPTAQFQQIVKAKNESRKAEIKKILEIGYPEIISLHDLATMTPKMLDGLMDKYNVSGETKKKAMTFFLQAAKYAELPLSSFLTEKIRNTSGTRRRRSAASPAISQKNIELAAPRLAGEANAHEVQLASGGTLTISITANPFRMPPEDRDFVFGLIDKLQEYENAHPPQEDDDESEGDGE